MILRVSATTYATGIYLSNNWYNPRQTSPPKPWPLNEIEELAVLQKLFQLAYAVPAELLVLEIDGVLFNSGITGKDGLASRSTLRRNPFSNLESRQKLRVYFCLYRAPVEL